jgi:hypothetical protein
MKLLLQEQIPFSFYRIFIYSPIYRLYHFGPKWLGGWEAMDPVDICTALSPRTSPSVWMENMDACQTMMDRHLGSYLVIWEIILSVFTLYCLFKALSSFVSNYLWRRTLIGDIKEILEAFDQKNYHFRGYERRQGDSMVYFPSEKLSQIS